MNKAGERLLNGLVKENPTLVLMLGMCPTLAVTTSAVNGFGMGATTLAVLALSNLIISLLRKVIPKRVRIPAFIVIIASFVTMAELLMKAYLYSLNKALGVYIPLIVVNCIILGRAESYAYLNPPVPALFDGIGMGLGFTAALTCIGAVRELLGAGTLFGFRVMPDSYEPALIFVLAPGAFFVLAALTALQNFVKERRKRAGKPYEKIGSGCMSDCMNCSDEGCSRRFYDTSDRDGQKEVRQGSAVREKEVPEASAPEGMVQEETESAVQESREPAGESVGTVSEEPSQEETSRTGEWSGEAGRPDADMRADEDSQPDREPRDNGAAQDSKAVPDTQGRAAQDSRVVPGSQGRIAQDSRSVPGSQGRIAQDNKAPRNGSGKAAQYVRNARPHQIIKQRKTSQQRRRKG